MPAEVGAIAWHEPASERCVCAAQCAHCAFRRGSVNGSDVPIATYARAAADRYVRRDALL